MSCYMQLSGPARTREVSSAHMQQMPAVGSSCDPIPRVSSRPQLDVQGADFCPRPPPLFFEGEGEVCLGCARPLFWLKFL